MNFFKKVLAALTATALLITPLSSCQREIEVRDETRWGVFDSYAAIYDYSGGSESDFERRGEAVFDILEEHHKLYDIYNEYDGISNLATVNREAGVAPVKVSEKIIDLLLFAKEMYALTGGAVDVTMGPVLRIWHNYRTEGIEDPASARLPSKEELLAAKAHTGIEKLVIDESGSTVYFADPEMKLDVGAIAKGYAAERAAEWLLADGAVGYVLDVGGNLRTVGRKPSGDGWQSGVRNPDVTDYENPYVYRFELSDGSAVTSGDYERYYTVDGKRYHHIISGETLMPAEYFRSVTVIYRDSGVSDALSTALFNMTYADGKALVSRFERITVVWVTESGEVITEERS